MQMGEVEKRGEETYSNGAVKKVSLKGWHLSQELETDESAVRRKWWYWVGDSLCVIEELNRYKEGEGGQYDGSMMERGTKMSLKNRPIQPLRSWNSFWFVVGIYWRVFNRKVTGSHLLKDYVCYGEQRKEETVKAQRHCGGPGASRWCLGMWEWQTDGVQRTELRCVSEVEW